MSRLYVAIVGLIGIVQRDNKGIFLIRHAPEQEIPGKKKIPEHLPRLLFRARGKTQVVILGEGVKRVDLQIPGGQKFDIKDDKKQFLAFPDIVAEPVHLDPGCEAGSCADLVGHVSVDKGVLLPIEATIYKHDNLPVGLQVEENITAKIKAKLRLTTGAYDDSFKKEKVASGALLEDSPSGEVKLLVETEEYTLEVGPLDEPRKIKKAKDNDFVVWIENLPRHHDHDTTEGTDFHFYLFYDFLVQEDAIRWVPVFDLGLPENSSRTVKGKRGAKAISFKKKVLPGSQCITPIMP